MNPLEVNDKVRVILKALQDGGPSLSLHACRQLSDLGFSPSIAWVLVEAALKERS